MDGDGQWQISTKLLVYLRWGQAVTRRPRSPFYAARILSPKYFFSLWLFGPFSGHGLPFWGFTITFRPTTVGMTPLDEWSVRSTDLYLTKKRHSLETKIHALVRIRTQNPGRQGAHVRWNRHIFTSTFIFYINSGLWIFQYTGSVKSQYVRYNLKYHRHLYSSPCKERGRT